jgi:hypothetical protein
MSIVQATALQSFDKFSETLSDIITRLLNGDNPENHKIPFRASIPGRDARQNIIIFGKNVSEQDRENYLSKYPDDERYRTDKDGKFLLDPNGDRVSSFITYYSFSHGLKGLYQIAKDRSIYLIANGINFGTKKEHGIKTVGMITIEGDYSRDIDQQFKYVCKVCKKYNIPEPTYYYVTGGKSLHIVWMFSTPIPAETAWSIRMQLLRSFGFDGAEGDYADGNSRISALITNSYRIGGKKEKPHKDGNHYYGSFKCFSLDNVYTASDFDCLFINPLGKWNPEFNKTGLDDNGNTKILCPEEAYTTEERLADAWADKFLPYDENEVTEAKKLLDSFTAEKVVQIKKSGSDSPVSITTKKEIEELRSQASNTGFDLLDLISLKNKNLIESGSQSGARFNDYKKLCFALNKTHNYLLALGLATKNTPADCLDIWANNSGLDNNHETRLAAFNFLGKTALVTFDPDSQNEKEVIALSKLKGNINYRCKRAKIANPLESKIPAPVPNKPTEAKPVNNNSAVLPGWGTPDKTDYSTFSKIDGGWKRFATGFDDLHIVFDSALLKDATEATIALKDIKQKADNWLDPNNQELLEPFVGGGRTIIIKGAKNWTRENLIALGSFCKAKGAGRVIIDGKRFEYYQVEGELFLSGKDVKLIHEPFLKPQYIIDLIDSEKAKAALIESTVGSNKTGAALCIALYYALKHNIPILWTAATRTLCHGTAARCFENLGYTLPVYDPETWLTKKPSKANFKGLIFCPDSYAVPTNLMEEYGIKDYILITDECSYTIYHSHFADTAITAKRAKSLVGISNLMAGATLSLYLEANITKPCSNWVESKIKGNILKIKNTYQAPRKFITWNQNSPYAMLNAMVDIKRKNPDATILDTTQAKELDSSLSPVNKKKFLVDAGFKADDIILLDDISDPSHPAHGITQRQDKFDEFFSETIKGKIVIGNPKFFSTGTNINKHCIDYCFDILQGKGTPMAALQQPMRVRDREGLERHIFINNCGLDHPKYKGYSTKKIQDSIEQITNRTNQEYEKLGGKADFSQLRSDIDSAEYAAHCQYLQTLFVKSYRIIAHGLMKREGWTLIDSDKWLEANVSSEEEKIIKEDSTTKEAFREIKLEGKDAIRNEIKNSELIDDDAAKNLRSSRTELSQEDKSKLDRYDFHKSTLGLVDATATNIMRWQDGYYKQLRYQFYFLKDSQQYLRLKESKNIEMSNKDGHVFDFDRLAKSNLAAYGFLRELGVDKLINEIRRIAKGESTENHIYLKEAPVKVVPTVEKCQKLGLDPDADHLGIPLNVKEGSPLELIALRLKADPIKCYNLLGFTPDKKAKTSYIIEDLIEKFGYARISNGKKSKAIKHYLILFDDAREDFFAHLLHQHKLSVYDANNPDHEYIFDLCCEGNVQAPITQDYKLVRNGLENVKQGEPNILDLLDIGGASPLKEQPQASLPNNVQPIQLSRQLTIPGIKQ